jgi:hypothetical protein
LLAAFGWVVFFFMFRTKNEADPDAPETDSASAAEPSAVELPGDPASAQLGNGNGAMPVDPADAALQGPVPPDPTAETGTSATRQHRGRTTT